MIILLTKDMKQYDIIFKNKRKLKRMLRMYCNRLWRQSSRCRSNTYITITSGKIYILILQLYITLMLCCFMLSIRELVDVRLVFHLCIYQVMETGHYEYT